MAEEKSFGQMQELAQQLHPAAIARLNADRRWEIVIPTECEESYGLDARFDGTPAARAFNTYESGETALERWGRKNGHGDEPLGLLALRYNLLQQHHSEHSAALDEALVARGLPTTTGTDFEAMTGAEFESYEALTKKTWKELRPVFAAQEAELNRYA